MVSPRAQSIDTRLQEILDDFPPDAAVIVEGGHLTLEVERVRDLSAEVGQAEEDRLLLLDLDPASPSLHGELERINLPNGKVWGVLTSDSRLLDQLGRFTPGKRAAYRVRFSPTETQEASLELALECHRRLAGQVRRLEVAILIGNLTVQNGEIRKRLLELCLPKSYRRLFAEYGVGDAYELFSEATCRNLGRNKLLDPRKKLLEDRDLAAKAYRERGYTILREEGHGNYYLASDHVLTRGYHPPLVALTKREGTPTCGLILAGKLLSMARQRFTHFLSVYDLHDDPSIDRKNLDGSIIFGHLAGDLALEVVLCTTNTVGGQRHVLHLDRFGRDELRRGGSLGDHRQLAYQALRRCPDHELLAGEAAPDTCCTLLPTEPERQWSHQ